ncbi:Protein of unknown function [Gryllus bimaculatus]|nr:Protein of unknown function [Gryllus bimaculatus]
MYCKSISRNAMSGLQRPGFNNANGIVIDFQAVHQSHMCCKRTSWMALSGIQRSRTLHNIRRVSHISHKNVIFLGCINIQEY